MFKAINKEVKEVYIDDIDKNETYDEFGKIISISRQI